MSISDAPRTAHLLARDRPGRGRNTEQAGTTSAFSAEADQPNMLRADIAPAAVAMLIVIGVLGLAAVATSTVVAAVIGFLTG